MTEMARGTERRTPFISLSTHFKQGIFKISSIIAKSKKSSAQELQGQGREGKGLGGVKQGDSWGDLFHHIHLHPSGQS